MCDSPLKNKIYYDNSATTIMPKAVINAMFRYANMGNPSASYESARQCKNMIEQFKQDLADLCEFSLEDFEVVFNSGATEGNAHIIRSVVDSFSALKGVKPRIITSSIEHKSILDLCEQLAKNRRAIIDYIQPSVEGIINPKDVEARIESNTALITIMAANNELGSINDIRAIGAIAHKHTIPFHTDAVQIFGKCPVKPLKDNVDAFTVSFHKLHGPAGIGMLVLRKKLIEGYHLGAQVCGSQCSGLRGGTENIMGIAGAYAATQYTMKNRKRKNEDLATYRSTMLKSLKDNFQICTFENYLKFRARLFDTEGNPLPDVKKNCFLVVLSPLNVKVCVPSTLLIALICTHVKVCNKVLRDELCKEGIVVSIGSACNTSSAKASHVLSAIGAPPEIKRGTLRISFGDENTIDQIGTFVKKFVGIVSRHRGGGRGPPP